MCSVASFVQETITDSLTNRTESSGSDEVVQPEFVQLSQKAAVCLLRCGTGTAQLSRKLGERIKRS